MRISVWSYLDNIVFRVNGKVGISNEMFYIISYTHNIQTDFSIKNMISTRHGRNVSRYLLFPWASTIVPHCASLSTYRNSFALLQLKLYFDYRSNALTNFY